MVHSVCMCVCDSGTHRESSGRQLLERPQRHCHYQTVASRRLSGGDHRYGDEIDDDLYSQELYLLLI